MQQIATYSAMVLSLFACVAAAISTFAADNTRIRRLEKQVNELLAEQVNAADLHLRMHKSVAKIRNRLNGDDTRAQHLNGRVNDGLPDPETDPEGWKLEIMRRNPRGALS